MLQTPTFKILRTIPAKKGEVTVCQGGGARDDVWEEVDVSSLLALVSGAGRRGGGGGARGWGGCDVDADGRRSKVENLGVGGIGSGTEYLDMAEKAQKVCVGVWGLGKGGCGVGAVLNKGRERKRERERGSKRGGKRARASESGSERGRERERATQTWV